MSASRNEVTTFEYDELVYLGQPTDLWTEAVNGNLTRFRKTYVLIRVLPSGSFRLESESSFHGVYRLIFVEIQLIADLS